MACIRTLYIDADACPVLREALTCARRAHVPVVIVGNTTQNLARHVRRDDPRDAEHARGRTANRPGYWVDIVDVSIGADSADFASRATIDMDLFIRHEEKKVRRAGGRTRGPAAFTAEDRERFVRNLSQLLAS